MVQLGKTDATWAQRAEYLLTRAPEEFFDLRKDPHCLKNLIEARTHQRQISEFKKMLADHLKRSDDPMSEVFQVYERTRSVPRMVETYAAMWEKHGIPGSIASNPVNRLRWENPEDAKKKKRERRRQKKKKQGEEN